MAGRLFTRREGDRRIRVDLVLCDFGFALSSSLTYWIELLPAVARQDHDADEAAPFVGSRLREHRVGPGLVPGAARTIRRRAAVRVDADAALDQAADARALMAVRKAQPPGGNATLSPRISKSPFGMVSR